MDSITHLAVGAITPLIFRKAPRRGVLVLFGIAAGELPDIDIAAGTGAHAMFSLHRGPTHSLILLPVFALILAALLKLFLGQLRLKETTVRVEGGEAVINKADDWPFGQMFLAALLCLIMHVYLDSMTTFGTQIFWPFSDYRAAFPALFIVDFTFSLPLILIMIYCLAGFRKMEKRDKQIKWARLGLLWAVCYPLLSLGVSSALTYKYNRDYTEVGTHAEKISLTPVLGSPFFWKAVCENDRDYHMGWVAAYKPFAEPEFRSGPYPKVDPIRWARLQEALPIFKEYANFATFPTVTETWRGDDYVEDTYRDLRYLYSVPNFLLELSGFRDGLFNMQTRRDAASGDIYAWRYLENGSDPSAEWTAVRPPVNIEE